MQRSGVQDQTKTRLFVTCHTTWQLNVGVAEPEVIVHARNKESVKKENLKSGMWQVEYKFYKNTS